jgi:hypothetical protein
MTTYTDVFGGTNIYPSDVSYLAFDLNTADVFLTWPTETNAPTTGFTIAARIMNVTCTAANRKVYLPDANQASVGECFLFNNTGNTTFTVVGSTGTVICTVASGTLWQVYMTNNTTVAGVWSSYQFGATTSTANAGALAGAGLRAITTTLNQAISTLALNSNYTLNISERARSINWTGASGTVSFATAPTLTNDWFCYFRNSGSSSVTLDPYSAELINGASSLSVAPGDSCMILCDGTGLYTVGLTDVNPTGFDYLQIDVSGTGNYTLSTFELDRVAYNLIGILTGNRNIIVPATFQQYWITNATTGSFDLTVTTLSGTGITVPQGEAQILYCNGTDVVQGQTSAGIATPIPIADGGTGSTTAGGALVNLGGTSTGIAVFTATDAAAARLAIDAVSPDEAAEIAIQYAVALG